MSDADAPAPPSWTAVRGQDAVVETLRTALSRDQLAHAWMLIGPPQVGQDAVARALAAALNCPEAVASGASEGCGTCETCRRIAADVHPASQTFAPEGASHLVSSVRERWIPTATRSLVDGRVKVLRIAAADRMNETTQNALLKILEEPPRTDSGATTVVWLLEAEDDGALLDTVVSRCRRLTMRPWTPEVLAELARQQLDLPDAERRAVVRAAMGSPRRLIELADADVDAFVERLRAERDANPRRTKPTDDDLDDTREELSASTARRRHLGLIAALLDQGPAAAVPLARQIEAWATGRVEIRRADNAEERARYEDAFRGQGTRVEWPPGFKQQLERRHKRLEREAKHEAMATALDELASYLRDVLAAKGGASDEGIVHVDHAERIRADAARTPFPALLWGLQAVSETREALERNGTPVLHLERLLLGLAVRLIQAA